MQIQEFDYYTKNNIKATTKRLIKIFVYLCLCRIFTSNLNFWTNMVNEKEKTYIKRIWHLVKKKIKENWKN